MTFENLSPTQQLELVKIWNKQSLCHTLTKHEYETFYLNIQKAFFGYFVKYFSSSQLEYFDTINDFFTYKFMTQKFAQVQNFGGLLNSYKNFLIDCLKAKQSEFENSHKISLDAQEQDSDKSLHEKIKAVDNNEHYGSNYINHESKKDIEEFFQSLKNWQQASIKYLTCIKLFSNEKPIPATTLRTVLKMSSSYAYQFRELGINSKMDINDYLAKTTIGQWIQKTLIKTKTLDQEEKIELISIFFENLCLFASSNYSHTQLEKKA